MGKVRLFREDDIPRIIELNTLLFPGSAALSPEEQERRFRTVCFDNPLTDPEISSLVYMENDGSISGFLGVMLRSMTFGNRPIRAALGHHLMVDKSAMASLQLFKTLFNGPQDLSFTDRSVDVARPIWERMGGSTSYAHSIYWRRPLRPSRLLLNFLKKKHPRSRLLSTSVPFCYAADSILSVLPGVPVKPRRPGNVFSEDLGLEFFLQCIGTETSGRKLRPVYSKEFASWLFALLEGENRFGSFRKTLLRDHTGDPAGWYIANFRKDGACEVIQIAGWGNNFPAVLRHLLDEAWQAGCIEVIGRLDPVMIKEFSSEPIYYSPGRNWMLIHSRNQEILRAFDTGDIYLTRLEGDLWLF